MFYPVFLILYYLASCLALLFYRRNFPFLSKKVWYISWFFVTFIFWVTRPAAAYLPDYVLKALSMFGGYWSFFLYYTLLLFLIHSVVLFVLKRLKKTDLQVKYYSLFITKAGLVIIFLCMIIGTFEAYSPVVRHEIITTKKITAPIRIVLISDLHLGTFLGKEYCEKMVERINSENPDLILIAGDIIDDRYAIVKRQTSIEPLGMLKAKSGVAAVLGNHDYFDRKTDEEVHDLKNLGISVLINESKEFDEIFVVGLKDFSKDQSSNNLDTYFTNHKNKFLILLNHQPRRIIEASKDGYDLYLAGHTHGGAFFPNQLFTSLIHKLDYGRKNFSDMTAIVTSGYGFFGIPVRLGVNPEYVVIDLKP